MGVAAPAAALSDSGDTTKSLPPESVAFLMLAMVSMLDSENTPPAGTAYGMYRHHTYHDVATFGYD